jgi:two-component system, NarL family, sensor histidine kinase UhpB
MAFPLVARILPMQEPADARARGRWARHYTRLFWRIFLSNAAALIAVAAIAIAVFGSAEVSSPFALRELAIVVVVLILMVGVNLALTRRMLAPLDELVTLMRDIDPPGDGRRVPVRDRPSEATELGLAFNAMLERLESEREESARRALGAQESERLRVAQELHDEVGQNLTAALLQLSQVRKRIPPELESELAEVAETVRENLEELRRIAQRLRPQALDELGLASALAQFTDRLAAQGEMPIERRLPGDLPDLSHEEELVVYRVAQEALTNVARHAGATRAGLSVARTTNSLEVRVFDDGRGVDGAEPGAGIQGMRERAATVGADLSISARPEGGTVVELRVPLDEP